MAERSADLPANVDIGVLGQAMLEAARAARIGVTVTVLDPSGPRNIYVSDAAVELFGRTHAELLGCDPLGLVAPEDHGRLLERLAMRVQGDVGQSSYEITAIGGDGRRIPIEVTASSVTIEGRRAVFAFIVDVSARKAAEAARLQTEARFRELIDKGPEPILIVRAGQLVYANGAFASALGYSSPEEMWKLPMSRLVHGEDQALLESRMNTLLVGGERLDAQVYRAMRRDGSTVLLEASSVPFEYQGEPAILTMARDVTDRRTLEARLVQADRLAALGTMAAGVAHEVNNPLAYVMLNLDWIARKLSEGIEPANIEGLTELIREARRGAERVATIVRELRRFSRADGETMGNVDLESVVRSAIRIAAHETRHRARVVTSFSHVRPVWADEGRVEQVVINLLLNAAQAMPEARASENEIRVSVRASGDDVAVLEVSDNGLGIPADVLPRIFDPFFTTKPPGVGTGLGLSICHGIVASLGGQITVHSDPSEGTTFRVVFPMTTAAGEDDDPDPAPSDPPPSPIRVRARVLVVDDEVQIANTMRELLALDHDVIAATSGPEALAIVRSGRDFDVVFCDLMMPLMGGIELFARFRDERPGLERRIVFMTGGAFTTRAAEFLASIDNRRVEKPFSLGMVERIVSEMCTPKG